MALHQLASVNAALAWLHQRGALALATDSRRVRAGDAFIAWPGHALDGRQYVRQAIAAGASACLVEAQGVLAFDFGADDRIAAMPGLKAATGAIASGFMGSPSERLSVIACTGTNGKTSTAWWTAQALTALGRRCAVVGTLGIGEPPRGHAAQGEPLPIQAEPLDAGVPKRPAPAVLTATGLTTPDPVTLQAALRQFVDAGFKACAIEASSIGIVEHRLTGTRIEVVLFTNFTQDHLDFHGSMAAYWEAKARLFAWPGLQAAVINIDDAQGADLAARLRGGALKVWTYSMQRAADLRATNIRYDDDGLCFDVHEAVMHSWVRTRMIGDYNVANLLAVIGGLRALGVTLADAALVCAALTTVPGRMQRVPGAGHGPQVVVDYAHTPDALEKALLALQPLARERGGQLWCVFGCGGNRDPGKRPMMGALAAKLAQRVVVTSDNPRSEPPDFIISQILAGVVGHDEVDVIESRRDAIAYAVQAADARDVILVAGKGHEDYQEIAGVKQPFSDLEQARLALQMRGARA